MTRRAIQFQALNVKETDNTTVYGYGCDMSNKYYGSCPIFSYVCTWYQWHVIPEGELYKVYKLNMRGFEIDFEYTHGATTHMVTMSDRDMNSNMNLVVADGLAVPMSISGITRAEHFFSDHIVEIGNNYYDVDAAELNLPMKNRVGDIQIDDKGKITIDPLSIIRRSDDGNIDCAMNKPAIDEVKANKKFKDFKATLQVSDGVVKQKLSSHCVAILFSHSKLEQMELSKPCCKMAISYSHGCRGCNQNLATST